MPVLFTPMTASLTRAETLLAKAALHKEQGDAFLKAGKTVEADASFTKAEKLVERAEKLMKVAQ